ncbi:hypothetical protein [Cupriavidus sp. UYPR2.512]|uniref:hypothetical protein n=1 Tax=Cupriavidus sp. UYPR2.512 TaxID=1080187 RepID=UPI0003659AC5|nr:hypothetical protein [Cupriavidus sp. UYPR2.512]UIF88587.1 hypothetical protein KAF44_25075 [Cupriavidus necator]
MSKKSQDQIFQVSLTEVAFTVTFILLLLLGYKVMLLQRERDEARRNVEAVPAMQTLKQGLESMKDQIGRMLSGAGVRNPDEVISKLVEGEKAKVERVRLQDRIKELDKQLTALSAIKANVEKAGKDQQPQATADQVINAINTKADLYREVKVKLGVDIQPGKEAEIIRKVIEDAGKYAALPKEVVENTDGLKKETTDLKKDNAGLRGQIAFLQKRLNANGGRDYPPCWLTMAGKIEYLFAMELRADGIVISPAWPSNREQEARALSGMAEMLSGPMSEAQFSSRVRGIFDWSNRQSPACRHYVQIKSLISDAVQSDRTRLTVENFFYKTEIRR